MLSFSTPLATKKTIYLTVLVTVFVGFSTSNAQMSSTDFRDDFLQHFRRSSQKVVALAQEIRQDKYEWAPDEGVMSIAQVYMHIARYNFYYLESSLGIPPPEGIDVEDLESITDKAVIEDILQQSVQHVNKSVGAMTDEDLNKQTILYGEDVAGWAVLLQLVSHMNEHVGQSVSYARMNGVVPPWSRRTN